MTRILNRTFTVALAVALAISAPCASVLAAAPSSCTMDGCGDGASVSAPHGPCCCAHPASQTDVVPSASLISKTLAGGELPAFEAGPPLDAVAGEPCRFSASPPSPVPLFLLHSSLLI